MLERHPHEFLQRLDLALLGLDDGLLLGILALLFQLVDHA